MKIHLLPDPFLFEYYIFSLFALLLFGLSFVWNPLQRFRNALAIVLLITPAIYFYYTIQTHIVDVPYIDDYDLLKSIYDLTHNDGFVEKVKVLFSQINQHRFGFERIVMLLILLFSGSENIVWQIVIGNAFLPGILFLLFKILQREKLSWFYLIPASWILFSLVYYENANWGIAALQNTPLLFFALLTGYLAGSGAKFRFPLAIVSAIITTFISGSGLLTWIIGAVIFGMRKKWSKLVIWIVAAISVCLFYFLFDYHFISSATGQSVFGHPFFNLAFVLTFFGNALYLDRPHPRISGHYLDTTACLLLGTVIAVIFVLWFFRWLYNRKNSKTDYFILSAMMFSMGTGAMLVMSRPIDFMITNGGELFSRRYMIFGAVLACCAYLAAIVLTSKVEKWMNKMALLAGAFAVLLNFVSYYTSVAQVRKQYELLSLDRFYWENHRSLLSFGDYYGDQLFWNHPTAMRELVKSLAASHIYDFPKTQIPFSASNGPRAASATGIGASTLQVSSETKLNWTGKPSRFITIDNRSDNNSARIAYFQLRNAQHRFIFPALPQAHTFTDFISTRDYYSLQTQFQFFSTKVLEGSYEIWIVALNTDTGEWEQYFSGQNIKI